MGLGALRSHPFIFYFSFLFYSFSSLCVFSFSGATTTTTMALSPKRTTRKSLRPFSQIPASWTLFFYFSSSYSAAIFFYRLYATDACIQSICTRRWIGIFKRRKRIIGQIPVIIALFHPFVLVTNCFDKFSSQILNTADGSRFFFFFCI